MRGMGGRGVRGRGRGVFEGLKFAGIYSARQLSSAKTYLATKSICRFCTIRYLCTIGKLSSRENWN